MSLSHIFESAEVPVEVEAPRILLAENKGDFISVDLSNVAPIVEEEEILEPTPVHHFIRQHYFFDSWKKEKNPFLVDVLSSWLNECKETLEPDYILPSNDSKPIIYNAGYFATILAENAAEEKKYADGSKKREKNAPKHEIIIIDDEPAELIPAIELPLETSTALSQPVVEHHHHQHHEVEFQSRSAEETTTVTNNAQVAVLTPASAPAEEESSSHDHEHTHDHVDEHVHDEQCAHEHELVESAIDHSHEHEHEHTHAVVADESATESQPAAPASEEVVEDGFDVIAMVTPPAWLLNPFGV